MNIEDYPNSELNQQFLLAQTRRNEFNEYYLSIQDERHRRWLLKTLGFTATWVEDEELL